MRDMQIEEDQALRNAGWVNQQQGVVRVPIDVAIDVIAARGVAPLAPDQAPAKEGSN
jgi:hypothetical protein